MSQSLLVHIPLLFSQVYYLHAHNNNVSWGYSLSFYGDMMALAVR